MKKYAVIVAGGSGLRMGNTLPKQFMLIRNKPVLYYTLKAFLEAYNDMQVILVIPDAYTSLVDEIIDAYFDKERIRIAAGGNSRFESVQNGLQMIEDESIIFVHDAVRCNVSKNLIHRCFDQAMLTGTAIPAIASTDSVRIINEEGDNDAIDRNRVMLVQTPQVFHSKILIPAFGIDSKPYFTDEASVVETLGVKLSIVQGERDNIKITHPVDLQLAAHLLYECEDE